MRHRSRYRELPPAELVRRRVVHSAAVTCERCGKPTGGASPCRACAEARQDARRAADLF
jgi:hypothetical protein